jgi:hypothetical protein
MRARHTLFERLAGRFVIWALRRCRTTNGHLVRQEVVTFEDRHEFWRYAPFWPDESIIHKGKHWNRPPWWRPFNALLHHWNPDKDYAEPMHDHPRWSVTLCLRGRIVERTPWGERLLTPGAVVVRSRKAIHSFTVPDGYAGRTWTLFVVGRRDHAQNTYVVTPRGRV